jgi:hypothetical protein
MNHNQYGDGEPQSVHDTGVFKAMIEEINAGEIWISPEGARVEVIDAKGDVVLYEFCEKNIFLFSSLCRKDIFLGSMKRERTVMGTEGNGLKAAMQLDKLLTLRKWKTI